MPDPRTDQQLIQAANRGDDTAFAALYHRHKDWALRLAFRFTNRHHDALDVVQETFIYLARKFPGFTLTAAMTTFLYPVVKNLSLQIVSKRRRENLSPLENIDPPSKDPPPNPSDPITQVLARLPEPHAEVILMRFVDAMSLDQIATALQVPLGTVKSRLHNALSALRADPQTAKHFDQPPPP